MSFPLSLSPLAYQHREEQALCDASAIDRRNPGHWIDGSKLDCCYINEKKDYIDEEKNLLEGNVREMLEMTSHGK